MPRPHGQHNGQDVPNLTIPPYNEIVDSLLTGYLWGCLLVALFLVVYFAISFCVWVMSAIVAAIDSVIDRLRSCCSRPEAGTNVASTASPWSKEHETKVRERVVIPNEIEGLT
jgi:hypothetical protein